MNELERASEVLCGVYESKEFVDKQLRFDIIYSRSPEPVCDYVVVEWLAPNEVEKLSWFKRLKERLK